MDQRVTDAAGAGRPGTTSGAGVAGLPEAGLPEAGPPEAALTSPFDPSELRAWRAFLTAHARVTRQLEKNPLARSGMPLAEFDVLMQLALAEGQRLRMNELASRVVLSRAGITRLVDRLVTDGLVARTKCPSDARGAYAVLTDPGRARLDQATPSHLSAVRRHFLDAFTRPELATLGTLLERSFPID